MQYVTLHSVFVTGDFFEILKNFKMLIERLGHREYVTILFVLFVMLTQRASVFILKPPKDLRNNSSCLTQLGIFQKEI